MRRRDIVERSMVWRVMGDGVCAVIRLVVADADAVVDAAGNRNELEDGDTQDMGDGFRKLVDGYRM
ncbi:hypothetical protein WN55_00023 [Dufourea novaeangliae]|uniref:Uncharacterized protein n=1 Tax=Dufourea novaeangliae TaxID=178035 RepID=A0A154NVZ9_DUFNO|nr:hypothetical protein WN55_00023 [Dufourea novaeangliae]